ncbi:MAG: ATP-binding protein [Bacillota bacterium]
MLGLKYKSIETKMIVFFTILTIVLFGTVGLLFFESIEMAINASKEEELSTLARETANKIERFLFERYGDIQVMAKTPLLNYENVSRDIKLEHLENVRKAYKTYDSIFTTDEKGNIEIISGELKLQNEYKQWIHQVLQGKIFVSDFIFYEKDKNYGVSFAAPIIDKNDKIHGAVVESMNFQAIADIVKNVQLGKSGHAYLLNEEGKSVLHPAGDISFMDVGDIRANGDVVYVERNDVQYVSAYYPIKKYDTQENVWYLVVEEPVDEAFQVTNRLRNYTFMIVLIAIGALFVLAIIMAEKITMPIKNLVRETQNILDGDIRQMIKVDSGDEIGHLARSFNMLLDDLKAMMQQVLEKSGEAASLAEIRQYVDKFFDDVPSGIMTVDSTGKITTFNQTAAQILGVQQMWVLGKNIRDPLAENITPIIKLLWDCCENGVIYIKHIVKIRNSHDIEIPIMINTSIQKDGSGKPLGVIGIFRSLEKIEHFEESVIRAKNLAALGELSAGMAHEIRNPLTSIKGFAQYIKNELGDQHELASDIDVIIHEVDRLDHIIDRFLTFARPSQPDLELESINDIVKAACKLLEKEAIKNHVQIKTQLQELPLVPSDTEQIEQVLVNMGRNAIQAMASGGELTMTTTVLKEENYVAIEISDTGVGIEPENYDMIFQPFFTTKEKGTGLGLAICLRIIENHKGFIQVSSSLGLGTTFTIKLPINN